jgi:hypothetical protein
MTVEFPRRLLREKAHAWNLVGVAATPGQTAQSVAPIIRSDGGGFWSCSMSDVSLSGAGIAKGRDRQKISTLLWRAVRQICDGGVNPIVVPRNDALFRPWPEAVAPGSVIDIPHSDGSLFSDGAGYYQSVINIVASAAAALRATQLYLGIGYAGQLMGGESFSINHPTMGWRMYEIATVQIVATDTVITFNPPLREAVPYQTQLEFDRPRCTMRLANPGSMDLSVQPWTFNTASVQFVEAPPEVE